MTSQPPIDVLLVEDSDADAKLAALGFQRSSSQAVLHRVKHGRECLQFLRREGPFEHAPEPTFVLLDLNMPVMGGREVLGEVVADQALAHIPIVVLSTSDDDNDIRELYRLRCNSYVVKPVQLKDFMSTINQLINYWASVVAVPARSSAHPRTPSEG